MNDVEVWKELTDYPRSFSVLARAFEAAAARGGSLEALGANVYNREAGIDALALERAIVAFVALFAVKMGITPREYFERAFESAPADQVWEAMLEEWRST